MITCRPVLILLVCALGMAEAQAPIGDLTSTDANVKGAIELAATGMRLMSGSSVTVGDTPATVQLARGGDVRLCPRAALSLSTSQNGQSLLLALGAGAIETHYSLTNAQDTIITPDFRVLLIGPGQFDVAVSSDAHGNTCVRTLEGNNSAIVVEEQMGDSVRQLGPHDQALFHDGTVNHADPFAPPDCGCPPAPPRQSAAAAPLPPLPTPDEWARPKSRPGDLHVQIDAPFVYRDSDAAIPDPPMVASLRTSNVPLWLRELPAIAPPARHKTTRRPRKGIFHRVRSFFAAIFR
jgi:hypothetical protein